MEIPKFYEFMRPMLEALEDGKPRRSRDVADMLALRFGLSAQDRAELLPSGMKTRFADRVEWAATYLRQAQLIESAGRGVNRITQRGQDYLPTAPDIINVNELMAFQEFADFRFRKSVRKGATKTAQSRAVDSADETPEETFDRAYGELNKSLAREVIDRVKAMPPEFFEKLIMTLMLKLGYGGTFGSGKTLGRSGDGGVDGVINQDKLGLEKIYLQAKRWEDGTVGRKEIQAFVGALSGHGALKGVFITTSGFSREARQYAEDNRTFKLSLVDGTELANLMIENDLGVALVIRYDVKRIDSDFFAPE